VSKINIYVTGTGYAIAGPGVLLAVDLHQLTATSGEAYYTEKEHLYRVLIKVLLELQHITPGSVHIYNDTSLIEEMSGIAHNSIAIAIRKNIMPKILSIVYFNKMALAKIQKEISTIKEQLSFNAPKRYGEMAHNTQLSQNFATSFRRIRAEVFKRNWFNGSRTA